MKKQTKQGKQDVKIIEHKENMLRFKIYGINQTVANTLRRIILSEIPVMAIEKVIFYENSSILNDEILAHRLGLIPLKTDLKTYNLMSQCDCDFKGCGKCTAVLTLDVKRPGTIYSRDLISSDPNIIPAYEKIPIVKLTPKQNVKLEAIAQLGFGKDHVKWQAALASYEMMKDDGGFDFFVESYGQLSPREIIMKAFDVFNEKISQLNSELK
jgi:DNA-directed RNA polymerase subunit D